MMPFGVSSFAALIKGKGYVFVFPSDPGLLMATVLPCALFAGAVLLVRWTARRTGSTAARRAP